MNLNTPNIQAVAIKLEAMGNTVEGFTWDGWAFKSVVDDKIVRISNLFGTACLQFEGAYTSFAQIEMKSTTPEVVAIVIHHALAAPAEQEG